MLYSIERKIESQSEEPRPWDSERSSRWILVDTRVHFTYATGERCFLMGVRCTIRLSALVVEGRRWRYIYAIHYVGSCVTGICTSVCTVTRKDGQLFEKGLTRVSWFDQIAGAAAWKSNLARARARAVSWVILIVIIVIIIWWR